MDRKESVIKMGKEGKLLSKLIALKRKKRGYKIQITWERILLIIVLITLFPELHDQMYLARSRSTRMEIFLNSEGMGYQLGEAISKKELRQLAQSPETWDCSGGMNWYALLAGVGPGEGFYTHYSMERDHQSVFFIYLKKLSDVFPSLPRVAAIELQGKYFKIYEISSEMSVEEAIACLERHGYKRKWEREYWKNTVSIELIPESNKIRQVKIRWHTYQEYKRMLKEYKKDHKN